MASTKSIFYKINRRIHLYTGLVMIPYIFVFGLSGIMFNHAAFMGNNRSVEYFQLNGENNMNQLFPNLNQLAQVIADSIRTKNAYQDYHIDNIKYNNTMILRNTNKEADHRIQIDLPSNKVQIMTLPDFVENNTIERGKLNINTLLNTTTVMSTMENILSERGIKSGNSRVQRIPDLEFDFTTKNDKYRITYNLQNGNYRITDLNKRIFKWNYFFTNLHQVHGYPLSGFSLQWLWVLFADLLAFLMIIWAISGIIMWYKMKRQFIIGLILLSISIGIALTIMIYHYELGF